MYICICITLAAPYKVLYHGSEVLSRQIVLNHIYVGKTEKNAAYEVNAIDNHYHLCYNVCMANPFRHPKTNARWTKQLFWEQYVDMPNDAKSIEPMFTLHQDRPGLVNFRREYVRLADPTGYKLANLYLENYDHFLLLMKTLWFQKAKAAWDVELDAKIKSEGLSTIEMFANGGEGIPPAQQFQAAKYLANLEHRKGMSTSKTPVRGRPSNEEVQGELKKQAEENKDFEDDLARIKLVK